VKSLSFSEQARKREVGRKLSIGVVARARLPQVARPCFHKRAAGRILRRMVLDPHVAIAVNPTNALT
jgi:hypothetical protein